mgnify:CR=1 FL=1
MDSSEYTSGFSGPAASHLAAPPSPRHEGNVGQAPSQNDSYLAKHLGQSGRWFTAESRPRHRASHSAVSMVAKQRSHHNREINKHGGLAEVYLGKADLVRKDARDIDMLGIFGRT